MFIFKAYKSVALRTYTIWCHHHHSLIPEHLHCPPKEPPTHQPSPLPTSHHSYPPAITPHPFPIPPILSNHSATFCPWICLFWTFYRWKEPYTMWSFVSAFFQLSMLAKFIHVETWSAFDSFFFFNSLKALFIYWLHWVFMALQGLSPVAASRGYPLLWCAGLSSRWVRLLWSRF